MLRSAPRAPRPLALLAGAFALSLFAFPASASGECGVDADCAPDEACLHSPGDCEEVCTDDGACEPVCTSGEGRCVNNAVGDCESDADCGADEHCVTVADESYCTPEWFGPCESADECGEGLACLEISGGSCSAPGCDPDDGECEPTEPVCEEWSYGSFCLPPYIGPCEADADCGEGFECVQSGYLDCAVSSDGEVTCEDEGEADTSEPGFCSLLPQPCESDEQCADGWSCSEAGGGGAPEPTEPCQVDPNGDGECINDDDSEDEPASSSCVPPYYEDIHGGDAAPGDAIGSDEEREEGANDDDDDPAAGASQQPADDDDGDEPAGISCAATGGAALPSAFGLLLLALRRRRR